MTVQWGGIEEVSNPMVDAMERASNMGHPVVRTTEILTLRVRMTTHDGDSGPRQPGYLWDLAVAKRVLISAQLTVFHQAAR